ncbi:MAG: hypothetical protein R2941_11995 [Desulfobacterales bacterium]
MPLVVIQHYMLLQRNLIYTGITRGRELVGALVGTRKSYNIARKMTGTAKRYTYLKHRLMP